MSFAYLFILFALLKSVVPVEERLSIVDVGFGHTCDDLKSDVSIIFDNGKTDAITLQAEYCGDYWLQVKWKKEVDFFINKTNDLERLKSFFVNNGIRSLSAPLNLKSPHQYKLLSELLREFTKKCDTSERDCTVSEFLITAKEANNQFDFNQVTQNNYYAHGTMHFDQKTKEVCEDWTYYASVSGAQEATQLSELLVNNISEESKNKVERTLELSSKFFKNHPDNPTSKHLLKLDFKDCN